MLGPAGIPGEAWNAQRAGSIDTTARTFRINTLTVDYSAATVNGALANASPVIVRGNSVNSSGVLVATRVQVVGGTGAAANDNGRIEGLITSFTSNADFSVNGEVELPRDTVHISRSSFLWNRVCYEQLKLRSYSLTPVNVSFAIHFEADFADIFEVRGMKRARRGEVLPPVVADGCVRLEYRGLDDAVRGTTIRFSPSRNA